MANVGRTEFALYRRLLRQARPYWPHLAGIFFLNLLAPALKLLAPIPLTIAVDCVLGSKPVPGFLEALLPGTDPPSPGALLALVVVLFVVIAFLGQLFWLGSWVWSTYAGEKLLLAFRSLLFGHAQRLSLSYHDANGTADSTYRIQYDAPAIRWVVVEGLIPLLTAGLTFLAMVIVITWINLPLALVALAVSPVLFLLSRFYGRRLRRRSKRVKELESSTLSVIQEVLASLRVVKAFGQEEREQERFFSRSSEGLDARLRLVVVSGGLALLVNLATAAGTAAVLLIGVHQIWAGAITLGELLLVMAYLAQLYGPLEAISTKMADLQASLVSAERCLALLDQGPDVVERPDARPLARAAGAVAFRDVSFGYTPDRLVLQGVSFEVPQGACVGVAGTTGAGKTTLMSLLLRFYDPTAGQVLLDGLDLRDYKLADVRGQFSIVLQESVLFSTSIAENIAYARAGAGEQDVIAAARAANAHDFISQLPEGYATRVGERGMQLSGGERQRIALARAFLKDAPLLILDEPTSSVDVKTEAAIMEALRRLMRGRTTFIIAHRLNTLENCDMCLHLEQGRLVRVTPEGAPALHGSTHV
jgi:ATP-binding cassette subfamily B protein